MTNSKRKKRTKKGNHPYILSPPCKTVHVTASKHYWSLYPWGAHGESWNSSREFPRGGAYSEWRVRGFHYGSAGGPNTEGEDRGFDYAPVPVTDWGKFLRAYVVCGSDALPDVQQQETAV